MTQSRVSSLIEALFNVAIGFGINFTANMLIFPQFGFHITPSANLAMGAIYTGISIVRSYLIRRFFNARLHEAAQRIARAA